MMHTSTRHRPFRNQHAIVIGGSITGLLAGRVLADHFQQVTIIERDIYPTEPAPRKGVPQSSFLHVLLQRGQTILEELFPGLANDLILRGAPILRDSRDVEFYSRYGTAKKKEINIIETLSPSRSLLDWAIRRRLVEYPNITFLENSRVTGLVAHPNQSGVAGVTLQTNRQPSTLSADWIIDASGKTSKTPQWLQKLGYDAPPETLINADIGYAHRIYRRPAHTDVDWQALVIWPALPENTRSGILYPIECDRWIVGVGGAAPDHPPTDEAGYLHFARQLSTPALYNAIKDAEPLSDILLYRGNENRRRAYERLSPYPEGLLVMGHAACAFNPIYAQGMTMAAIEAQILGRALAQHRKSAKLPKTHLVQHQIAQAETISWTMAVNMDQQYINRNQSPSSLNRVNSWYQEALMELVTHDAEVYQRMMLVIHMLKPPSTLFSPLLCGKVFAKAMRDCFDFRLLYPTCV